MGFLNKSPLLNKTQDGRHCVILDQLYFVDRFGEEFRTEANLHTDGGSVPRLFWPIIPPFGKIWWSFVFHDALFQNRVERWVQERQAWVKFNATEEQANALLFEAMISQNRNCLEACVVWINLNWFGWRAFRADRRNNLTAAKMRDVN